MATTLLLAVLSALTLDFWNGAPPIDRPQHFHAPILALNRNQSNNWAGYDQGFLEKNKLFNSVAGDWIVPTATRHAGAAGDQFSSTWVGIGGGCVDAGCMITDSTLIQAGTEQDVSASGQATYGAWWEIIPGPSVGVNLAVKPGDHVRVTIAEPVAESGVWTITMNNLTTGRSFATTVPYSSTRATIEWILETPVVVSSNGGPQIGPMPNLTTVSFTNAKANGSNPGLVDAEAIDLVDTNGSAIATPSSPIGGNAFNACTYRSSC